MKKYLWLTTLFLTSISFAAQLTPVKAEAERCEYYQTKNNKNPTGKAIAVDSSNDSGDEILYLGLDNKETKFKLQNRDFDNGIDYWKNGNTSLVFKQIKILNAPDNSGKYLESLTLKTNNQVIIKQNLLRICED